MINRVHVSLTEEITEEFNKIPTRLKSAVVRRLLEKYFIFRSKNPTNALGQVLTGNFTIEVKDETR